MPCRVGSRVGNVKLKPQRVLGEEKLGVKREIQVRLNQENGGPEGQTKET